MRHIKLFESFDGRNGNPDFKVGDYVYAIDTIYAGRLQSDTRYKITRIYTDMNNKIDKKSSNSPKDFCDIVDKNGREDWIFFLSRFISEEEYKFRKDANKYNL